MRESIGGAFLIQLVTIFLVVYVVILCVALVYAKTFRIKNQVINLLEEYETYDYASDKLDDYLRTSGYDRKVLNNNNYCQNYKDANYRNSYNVELISDGSSNGICVYRIESESSALPGYYYRVITFMSFSSIPSPFGLLDGVKRIPVSGETKVIYKWSSL